VLEEVALAALRLDEDELDLRERMCERDPGRTAARPDVDHRPAGGSHELDRAQRVLEQDAPCVVERERGQSRSVDDRLKPVRRG
jgi:hypothetical protein